ncbi:MAG: GtrA family protein [Dehalococcoidia bacterium]
MSEVAAEAPPEAAPAAEAAQHAGFWTEVTRFMRYAMIGLLNGALDFALLAVLVFIFDPQSDLSVVAANTTSFMVVSVNSFFLNSRLTFRTPRPILSRWFAIFLLINVGSLLISNGSLLFLRYLMEEVVGLDGRAAILAAKPPSGLFLALYGYISYRKLFTGEGPIKAANRAWRAVIKRPPV